MSKQLRSVNQRRGAVLRLFSLGRNLFFGRYLLDFVEISPEEHSSRRVLCTKGIAMGFLDGADNGQAQAMTAVLTVGPYLPCKSWSKFCPSYPQE